jgi:hypothetical protein
MTFEIFEKYVDVLHDGDHNPKTKKVAKKTQFKAPDQCMVRTLALAQGKPLDSMQKH